MRISIIRLGNSVLSSRDLAQEVRRRTLVASDDKFMSLRRHLQQIAQWHLRGLKIGFTNGCFDLIHPGHVLLLAHARADCDRLIVALNTDASVSGSRGRSGRYSRDRASDRHCMPDLCRSLVFFAEDTPLSLIEAIRPDLLVKGADYRQEEVGGGDIVSRHGGEVLLVDLLPGERTTATIERVKGARELQGSKPSVRPSRLPFTQVRV
jgi:D-beta-D-heptose 7-phosphate kinase / D-beta-D-heptose 1-phosphate adenosyltransferase